MIQICSSSEPLEAAPGARHSATQTPAQPPVAKPGGVGVMAPQVVSGAPRDSLAGSPGGRTCGLPYLMPSSARPLTC